MDNEKKYIADEHFWEREPADSFKYKLAEYMTKNYRKVEGPYGHTYAISSETILQMAKEELIKRGVVQKPAEWSKNDTVFLNEITDYFENKTVRLQHDLDMYAHWLKSLPERFSLQQKQEWSEEDDNALTYLHELIGFGFSENFMDAQTAADMRKWVNEKLKKYRP